MTCCVLSPCVPCSTTTTPHSLDRLMSNGDTSFDTLYATERKKNTPPTEPPPLPNHITFRSCFFFIFCYLPRLLATHWLWRVTFGWHKFEYTFIYCFLSVLYSSSFRWCPPRRASPRNSHRITRAHSGSSSKPYRRLY